MVRALTSRYAILRPVLALGWRWLAAAPFGALGTFSLFRDEFLSPERQQALGTRKMLAWLAWLWEWWAIAALITLLFLILEGAYREMVRLRRLTDQDVQLKRVSYSDNLGRSTTSTQPTKVFSLEYTPTRKNAEILIDLLVSTGRSKPGHNLFSIFRDENNLAGSPDGHLFAVFVAEPESLSTLAFKFVDRPMTRQTVKYYLAYFSGDATITAFLNIAGRGAYNVGAPKHIRSAGQTIMVVTEQEDG